MAYNDHPIKRKAEIMSLKQAVVIAVIVVWTMFLLFAASALAAINMILG